jgi:hypothetical protein
MEASIILAPIADGLDLIGIGFLRAIHYPGLGVPSGLPRPSSGNPILDQIYLAQKQQGLASKAVAGGVVTLSGILKLKPASLDALGKAFYLSQRDPTLADYLSSSLVSNSDGASIAMAPQVAVMRRIFAAAYGPEALKQVLNEGAW